MLQLLAPLAGCGLMMAVCMGAMALMRRGRHNGAPADGSAEIASLRDEIDRLRAQAAEGRAETEGEKAP